MASPIELPYSKVVISSGSCLLSDGSGDCVTVIMLLNVIHLCAYKVGLMRLGVDAEPMQSLMEAYGEVLC